MDIGKDIYIRKYIMRCVRICEEIYMETCNDLYKDIYKEVSHSRLERYHECDREGYALM